MWRAAIFVFTACGGAAPPPHEVMLDVDHSKPITVLNDPTVLGGTTPKLDGNTITGRVFESRRREWLPGATVVATSQLAGSATVMGITDETGRYWIEVDAGTYRVTGQYGDAEIELGTIVVP